MQIQQTSTTPGAMSYRVSWRDDGGRRCIRRFNTHHDARAFAASLQLAALDRGKTTLEDYVAQVWIPVYAPMLVHASRAAHQLIYSRQLRPGLGARPLRELTTELIAAWQADRLLAGVDPCLLHRALLVLSGILRTAVQSHYLEDNPARKLLEPVAAR